jgi:probable HAF family extracellular repeat protein
MTSIGTLGGYESNAAYVNDAGQVIGFSTIGVDPDPSGFSFLGSPIHSFTWQNGVMRDLGTLGGPDALPVSNCNNQRNNLVTGFSLINSTPNPDTGVPTMHPFLWQNGKMIDLGTLGGTQVSGFLPAVQCVNNHGQVMGATTLADESTVHTFFWDHGTLTDVGTLGGDNTIPYWLSNDGDVVGQSDLAGSENWHAFRWRNGVMTDLGSLGGTSRAIAINSKGQIVGKSRQTAVDTELQHAFLWENGGPMVDLNTLIPQNSPLELYDAENINDAGWIAGRGLPPGCGDKDACGHAFLLIPCDAAGGQSCENDSAVPALQNAAIAGDGSLNSVRFRGQPLRQGLAAWRTAQAQRYHMPPPRD